MEKLTEVKKGIERLKTRKVVDNVLEVSKRTKKWFWMMRYCKNRGESPANSHFWNNSEKAYIEFKEELKINLSKMNKKNHHLKVGVFTVYYSTANLDNLVHFHGGKYFDIVGEDGIEGEYLTKGEVLDLF